MGLVKKCVSLLRLRQQFPGYEKMNQVDGCAEENVIRYLKSWNKKLQQDEYGNLYLFNPGTPLLCAHMDTVQRPDDAEKVNTICLNNDGIIKGDNIIIGGDDKCGIAIAMEIYEKLGDQVSLLFPRQEETGMNGSRYFCEHHSDLLRQCPYCLVLDRRNASDIISNRNCYCSLEFQNELVRVGNEGGFVYEPADGLASDANNIRHHINCVNLSVGYYKAHTKDEYIVADEMKNAYEYVMYIVQHMPHNDWPIFIDPPKPEPVIRTVSDWGRSVSTFKPEKSTQGGLFDDVKTVSLLPSKKKDTRNKAQKETASYFKIKIEGELEVKHDLILYNEDFNDFIELPKGTYRIDKYRNDTDINDFYY